MRVVLASCRILPELDPDETMLVQALRAAGIRASVVPWDGDTTPFRDADLVVLRSTWNYFEDVECFLEWVRATEAITPVLNPFSTVQWNVHKTYLSELDKRGIAIIPTEFAQRGEHIDIARLMADRNWNRIVVKPTVSAGSFRTETFASKDVLAAQAFFDALVADRDAMVQMWMPSVMTYGERSLVWIDGVFSHAIRKSPRFAADAEQVSDEVPIADDERAFGERVLAPIKDGLLYARVDMVRDDQGVLRVMELELVEPSLFFKQVPRALERFVAAIARHLKRAADFARDGNETLG